LLNIEAPFEGSKPIGAEGQPQRVVKIFVLVITLRIRLEMPDRR